MLLPGTLRHTCCYNSAWRSDSIRHCASSQLMSPRVTLLPLRCSGAAQMSCCRSSCRHVWIRMPGFVPSGPPHYWSSVVICCQHSCVSDSDRTSYETEGHIQTDSHLVVKEGQKDYLSLEVSLIAVSQECWILSSLDICCPFLKSFASCMKGKKIKS